MYSTAYTALATVTPIPADCGTLCGARCCKGDTESGMLLFPGEAAFLQLSCPTRIVHGVAFNFFVCNGTCRRSRRPLACRIFPLAPYYDGSTLRVIPDPRARYLCPLLSPEALPLLSPEFYDAVQTAFAALLPAIPDALVAYSRLLDDYRSFTK